MSWASFPRYIVDEILKFVNNEVNTKLTINKN